MTEETLTRGNDLWYEIHGFESKLQTVTAEQPEAFWAELYQRGYSRKEFFKSIGEENRKRVEDLEQQIRDVFVEALTQRIAILQQEFEAL